MIRFAGAVRVLFLLGFFYVAAPARADPAQSVGIPGATEWSSNGVQHVIGFSDAKPKDRGSLTLSAEGFRFTGKSGSSTISRRSIFAVSTGDERVELWGKKGQILRAAIPNGGGIAAAMVMHHRVDILTVEYADAGGGYRGAVFLLPAQEAARALEGFRKLPFAANELRSDPCQDNSVRPRSVLLALPDWTQVEVPAAYRALVYERLYEHLSKAKGIDHVYRVGEKSAGQGCPESTLQITVDAFKEGNQVRRASLGPVGMFVGTTLLKFAATVTDASGKVALQEELRVAVRSEDENMTVANSAAKKLVKHYSKVLKNAAKREVAGAANLPREPAQGVNQ